MLASGFQGNILNGLGVSQWQGAGYPLVNTPSVLPKCSAKQSTRRHLQEVADPCLLEEDEPSMAPSEVTITTGPPTPAPTTVEETNSSSMPSLESDMDSSNMPSLEIEVDSSSMPSLLGSDMVEPSLKSGTTSIPTEEATSGAAATYLVSAGTIVAAVVASLVCIH